MEIGLSAMEMLSVDLENQLYRCLQGTPAYHPPTPSHLTVGVGTHAPVYVNILHFQAVLFLIFIFLTLFLDV